MGRPRKNKATNDEVAAALAARVLSNSEENATETATEKDREVAEIVDELKESGNRAPEAWIYRQDQDTGKETFLDKVAATMVDESWLARNYGGGDYRVQIRGFRDDTGKFGYLAQRRFSVDANIPRRTPKWATGVRSHDESMGEESRDAATSTIERVEPDADMALLLKSQILDMVRSSAEQRRTDSQMQQASIQMMMSMMKQSSDMMQTMMATMLAGRQDGAQLVEKLLPVLAPRQSDPLELLAKLKAIEGPKQGLGEIVEAIRSLRESSELFAPPPKEDDDGMLSVVKSLAPGVMGMLTQAHQQRERAIAPTRSVAAIAPQATTVASPSEPTQETDPMFDAWQQIAPFVPMIVEKAATDEDATEYAYSVVGFVPMMMRGTLRELANGPDAAQEFMRRFAPLRPYPQWTQQFVEGIRAAINPTPLPDSDDSED